MCHLNKAGSHGGDHFVREAKNYNLVHSLCFIWDSGNLSLYLNRELEEVYMPIKMWSVVGGFLLRAQSQSFIQVLLLSYQAAALEQRGFSHWPWHRATPITTGTSAEESTTPWYQSHCAPTAGPSLRLRWTSKTGIMWRNKPERNALEMFLPSLLLHLCLKANTLIITI